VNALDTATGTEKWTYTLDEGLTTAPAIIGNTIYVTSTLGNKTYDLNAESGNLLWSFQTGGYLYSSPAVVDGIAYFGTYDGNF
jgi:outer membrane protein assembly factor BamB